MGKQQLSYQALLERNIVLSENWLIKKKGFIGHLAMEIEIKKAHNRPSALDVLASNRLFRRWRFYPLSAMCHIQSFCIVKAEAVNSQ